MYIYDITIQCRPSLTTKKMLKDVNPLKIKIPMLGACGYWFFVLKVSGCLHRVGGGRGGLPPLLAQLLFQFVSPQSVLWTIYIIESLNAAWLPLTNRQTAGTVPSPSDVTCVHSHPAHINGITANILVLKIAPPAIDGCLNHLASFSMRTHWRKEVAAGADHAVYRWMWAERMRGIYFQGWT